MNEWIHKQINTDRQADRQTFSILKSKVSNFRFWPGRLSVLDASGRGGVRRMRGGGDERRRGEEAGWPAGRLIGWPAD